MAATRKTNPTTQANTPPAAQTTKRTGPAGSGLKPVQDPRLADAVWLRCAYVDFEHGINRIGSKTSSTDAEVRRALQAVGITLRVNSSTRTRFPKLRDAVYLVDALVTRKLTLRAVSREVGCSEQAVRDATLRPAIAAKLAAAGWDKAANATAVRNHGVSRSGIPSPTTVEIIAALKTLQTSTADGWVTIAQITEHLDPNSVSYPTMRRHLNRLTDAGKISRRKLVKGTAGRPPYQYRTV